jgi:glycosyltransferase involved in cell wall biosynthesis
MGAEGGARPYVVCLLSARDCAPLLPGWFDSISRVADAVVALDDGSADQTGALLSEHPLVVTVLSNPPRGPGFHDWDDGFNRNRLLAAASELSPVWVITVDADERIPVEDAAALRRFLQSEAKPGYGYGLRRFRMIGDPDHYDRLDYDAYRLFAFEPGQVFPDDRLHASPIPTSIPPDRWRETTIRMKHLVSLTEADREARREKYRQADPDCISRPDYDFTVEPPGMVKAWETRPLDLPVLVHPDVVPGQGEDLDLDGPVITVVVAVEPGEQRDAVSMLERLAGDGDERIELLAATRDGYAASVLRRDLEGVVVLEIAPELTEAGLRNAALERARGDYVTFLLVGDRVATGGIEELIDAHEAGHDLIRARTSVLSSVYVSFPREPLRARGGFGEAGLLPTAAQALLELGLTTVGVSSVTLRPRAKPRSDFPNLLGVIRGGRRRRRSERVGIRDGRAD